MGECKTCRDNPLCKTCLYYGHRTKTCDYLLITRTRRGCPIDSECRRYASNARAKALVKEWNGGASLSDEEMMELYDQGLSDMEIARAIKRNRSLVAHWRNKMGLPAQREIEVEARGT